jgi:peptide/nickel transport system ATP-binding protein
MMLAVEGLSVALATAAGPLSLLDDVSFGVKRGEVLGVVGESGSGKTMLALAIMRLLPEQARAAGRILLEGEDLLTLDEAAMCRVRGARIGMIFQEPASALNPVMRVGDQIAESLRWHGLGRGEARREALRLMERVHMPEARRRLDAYPHELSGGQRQRIGIAIALAARPALLIADEPTTALDVTVQSEILDLLAELVQELGMALMLVSHDFGIIAEMADRVLVLYAGARVEEGPAHDVLQIPAHPYTRGLLAAVPLRGGGHGRLTTIPGSVPPPSAGRHRECRFAPRCPLVLPACRAEEPAWRDWTEDHGGRCLRLGETA